MGPMSPAAAVTPVVAPAAVTPVVAPASVSKASVSPAAVAPAGVTEAWVRVPARGGDMMQADHGGRRYCGGGVGRRGRAEQHCAGYRGGAHCTGCEATSGRE
jgi:hypothetical protein